MVSRHAMLALLAVIASAGCRAAGFNDAVGRPGPIATKPTLEAATLIERWNANASRIASLEAHPTITIGSLSGGDRAVVKGDMAVERPRNFRLLLEAPVSGRPEADLGSNDREFWFWSHRNNRDKAIYVCEYDEAGASPLAATMQPDWIVEAMGLRTIRPEEAAGATIKADPNGLDTILTVRRRGPRGETLIKETVIETATGRIKEHRLYGVEGRGSRPVLLASARISKVQQVRAPAPPGEPSSEPVTLPQSVRLTWHQQQKFVMDVALNDVKVNPRFDDEQRAYFFTEPVKPGFARKSLGEGPGLAGGPTTIRESRTIPPSPSAKVQLGDPIPIGPDGEERTPADPRALDADLPPLSSRANGPGAVVGARVPTVPEGFPTENLVRQDLTPPGFER